LVEKYIVQAEQTNIFLR